MSLVQSDGQANLWVAWTVEDRKNGGGDVYAQRILRGGIISRVAHPNQLDSRWRSAIGRSPGAARWETLGWSGKGSELAGKAEGCAKRRYDAQGRPVEDETPSKLGGLMKLHKMQITIPPGRMAPSPGSVAVTSLVAPALEAQSPVGSVFLVNPPSLGTQDAPDLQFDERGNLWIAWLDSIGFLPDFNRLIVRAVSPEGRLGTVLALADTSDIPSTPVESPLIVPKRDGSLEVFLRSKQHEWLRFGLRSKIQRRGRTADRSLSDQPWSPMGLRENGSR